MLALKLTRIGASAGFIVPKEVQARLGIRLGDLVYLTEAPDGRYRLTVHNPDFARQMKLAEQIMHDDHEILRALAK